jgi:hypothetical protein
MPRSLIAGIAAAITVFLFTASSQAQSTNDQPASEKTAPEKTAVESKSAVQQLQEAAELEKQSQEAYAAEKWVAYYVANMKLSKLRPYQPEYMVNIVRACARLGRKSTAYHYMLKMQQQGMSYDFNSVEDSVGIRDTEAYGYINNLLLEAGHPAGEASTVFDLPEQASDYQVITWDSSRERYLVGTLAEGSLMAISEEGETELLLKADEENGLWSIMGLSVDEERNRLWISSSATPHFSGFSVGDKNHGALFELDLKTLEVIGRFNLPVDALTHELGSLAVTADGHVYVIDRATPIVYHKLPDSDRLEAFFASPDLIELRDIAVTPDNSRVFIADAYKGILVIDPVAQRAGLLTGPETLNLGGINAMEYQNGHLFLVQGGFNPQRIVRMQLDVAGAGVAGINPMVVALPEFDQPGPAAIQGDKLVFFANSAAAEKDSLLVMASQLDASAVADAPDVNALHEAMKEQMQ